MHKEPNDWVYGFWFLVVGAAFLAMCYGCGGQPPITETKPPDAGKVVEHEEPEWLNEINKRCKEWKTYWFWYEGKLENVAICTRF